MMDRLLLMVAVPADEPAPDARLRLDDVLDRALRAASIPLNRVSRDGRAGNRSILLPVGGEARAMVPAIVHGLVLALDEDRKTTPQPPLRLVATVVRGSATRTGTGWTGTGPSAARRLLGSGAGRAALDAQSAGILSVLVPDPVYRDALEHATGDVTAAGFESVQVATPGSDGHIDAWIRTWTATRPEGRGRGRLRDALAAAAGGVPDVLDGVLGGYDDTHDSSDTAEHSSYESVESHEVLHEVVAYVGDDHTYVVEHYDEHAGYESSESSGGSEHSY